MKKSLIVSVALLLGITTLIAQDFKMPTPAKEHEFLKQFVGEWETDMEAVMAPGQPPMKCKGSMSSKAVGGFWVLNEITGDMMGTKTLGYQTIGYDPGIKKYIGTWVDSMNDHMWKYSGTVDSTGKHLTLEADGPSFTDPKKTCKFKDAYEFKSKDHIVATSSMQGDDGKWTVIMSGNMKRKK
ncbi:MAG: DUF1579 domain-containing protein [Gemmatales bacterium]